MFAAEPAVRSSDGRWLLQADDDARTLVAIDTANGAVVRRIPVADRRGKTSRVARIVDAPPRASFVVLFADIAEAWELSYDPHAEPVYDGLVHDYRTGEGIAERGPFAVRRIFLDEPLADAEFSTDFSQFTARTADGSLHVINLHVRRRIEILPPGAVR
ncbi:MAG: cytochrome D1 domain-containing protein [Burkholderiaceae bacterium]